MLLGAKHARGEKIGQVADLSVLTSGKQFDAAVAGTCARAMSSSPAEQQLLASADG
jgi:hypothetical protein